MTQEELKELADKIASGNFSPEEKLQYIEELNNELTKVLDNLKD